MRTDTKQRVAEFLIARIGAPVSPHDIAHGLGMSVTAISVHINRLIERNGFNLVASWAGEPRPSRVYTLVGDVDEIKARMEEVR